MKTDINMGILGINIFNTRLGWYTGKKTATAPREATWGKFEDATEWSEGEEREVEEMREKISGSDCTYTVALLQ